MRSLKVLGGRIKQLREEYGWTQDYLAKEITRRYKSQGVKAIQSHIGNLESPGTFKLPSLQLAVALAQVLEVTLDYLCGLTDDQSPPEPRFYNENERARLTAELDRLQPEAAEVQHAAHLGDRLEEIAAIGLQRLHDDQRQANLWLRRHFVITVGDYDVTQIEYL